MARAFGLPKACRCTTCGHVIKMVGEYEGMHCPQLGVCKVCGVGRYMRAWELER